MAKEDNLSPKEREEVRKEIEKSKPSKLKVLRLEFRSRTSTALITAFGVVMALSWQNVIQKLANNFIGTGISTRYPYLGDLYSSLIVTVFGVTGILLVSKWSEKGENK